MITITRRGFLGRMSTGKGEKQIPLSSVSAVQFKQAGPVVNGYIQFTIPGGNERRSAFGRQTLSAAKDENSVVFRYGQRKEFERLREEIQAALAAGNRNSEANVPQQIKELAELRDSGALTDEEFHAAKAKLLSS